MLPLNLFRPFDDSYETKFLLIMPSPHGERLNFVSHKIPIWIEVLHFAGLRVAQLLVLLYGISCLQTLMKN